MRTGKATRRSTKRATTEGVLLLVCLIACLSSALFGQMNTADITGNITDPSGALIPRATVTALQLAAQGERGTA
jgi:hypothetical protein